MREIIKKRKALTTLLSKMNRKLSKLILNLREIIKKLQSFDNLTSEMYVKLSKQKSERVFYNSIKISVYPILSLFDMPHSSNQRDYRLAENFPTGFQFWHQHLH